MTNSITNVQPDNVPALTYDGKPVVTTALLSSLYGVEHKHIQNNFRRNADRFEHGKHFYKVEGNELKELKKQPSLRGLVSKMVSHIVLWTERGAARHAKMLETDQAWDVFESLEDHYFGPQTTKAEVPALPNPLTPAHQREIQKAVARRCQALPEAVRRTAYQSIYRHLKDRFEVGSYKDIDESRYTEALGAVQSFDIQGDFLARVEKGALPLNADDLANLKALCIHAQWVRRQWEMQLRPALAMLNSPEAHKIDEHISNMTLLANHLQRKAEALPSAA